MDNPEPITPDMLIGYGEAISRLLNEDGVQRVFTDLKTRYYQAWKAAKSLEEREYAGAQVRALDDLKDVLEGTVQSGLHSRAMKDKSEQAEHQA